MRVEVFLAVCVSSVQFIQTCLEPLVTVAPTPPAPKRLRVLVRISPLRQLLDLIRSRLTHSVIMPNRNHSDLPMLITNHDTVPAVTVAPRVCFGSYKYFGKPLINHARIQLAVTLRVSITKCVWHISN